MGWSTLLSSLKARGSKSAQRVPRGQVRRNRTVPSLEMLEERNLLAICSVPPLLTGHVDGIEANFANGQWQMGTWERDTDTHDAPGAVLFVAKPAAKTTQPDGDQWAFLGAGAGNAVWILPQYQDSNLLYLGTNSEGTDPADLLSYKATDSRLPQDVAVAWIKASVVAVRGPGDLSIYSTDSFGTPTVWVDTADNTDGHTGGQLDSSDALWFIAGGHVHYNWGFTARGYYEMEVQATAFLPDGTPTSSQVVTYYLSAEQPGCLEFSASSYAVNETAGTATITVTRSHGSDGPVTIDYATSDGTALAGEDYTATSGTLSFANGETSKTITIPILDDAFVENNETINLTLSNPTGGAELGMQSTSVLTIEDNDVATVQNVQVNPGSGQSVTSLTVTFSDIVTAGHGSAGIDSGAFELVRYDGGPAITGNFTTTTVDHQTVVTLTFSGDDVVAGALPDGDYTLIVHHDKVHDFLGHDLDGGTDFTFDFSSPVP
jgi:surface-anchored protein